MSRSDALGAYVPTDWDAEGGGVAGVVATLLRALGYGNAFCSPPPARLCCEPIVLTQGAWQREARLADGTERGRVPVDVLVCCEAARDAEATCRAVERDLRWGSWTGAGEGWRCRVAAVDSGGSAPRGRDGSGRWLWGFTLILTVVIDFGGQG